MRLRPVGLIQPFLVAAVSMTSVGSAWAHNGLAAGHSPPSNGTKGEPLTCESEEPLRLFILPDPLVGGPITQGANRVSDPGDPTVLAHVAISAALARPEFGGYVYSGGVPGFHFVDAANECHALTTAFTGGAPFVIRLQRTYWPNAAQMGMVDEFGVPLLVSDGAEQVFGDQNGAHFHPVWLHRRPGQYAREFRVTSSFFGASERFSLQFEATACWGAVPIDLSEVFNADVVDSGAGELLTAFDGAGHYWLLNGVYGTQDGLPGDGMLDIFQLGGPAGDGLTGSASNALLDNGTLSTSAMIDLVQGGLDGNYESAEVLIAASGSFTSSNQLVIRMGYASGTAQVVTLRRAASAPRFFPLLDWQISSGSPPELSIGKNGNRNEGFSRSNGLGIDDSVSPPDSFYFQRVTFPVDPARSLTTITFDDYVGAGRVGIFALSLTQAVAADGDPDGDGTVGQADWDALFECAAGPDVERHVLPCPILDHDCDGDVDLGDFSVFQNDFGQ